MKGFIKIESATLDGDQGLRVEVNLEDVSDLDRFHVLSCVQRSLEIPVEDVEFLAFVLRTGLLDETLDFEVQEQEYVRGPSEDILRELLHRGD